MRAASSDVHKGQKRLTLYKNISLEAPPERLFKFQFWPVLYRITM